MSFRCDNCHGQVKSGIPQVKRVTRKRERAYKLKPQLNKLKDDDEIVPKKTESKGWEIVKEVALCPKCAC